MRANAHACTSDCAQRGICHIDVLLKKSSKTFVGKRGSFQNTFQEMNGARKKCARALAPGETTHARDHSCIALEVVGDEAEDGNSTGDVHHYCDVRCPCCSYYCQREYGHQGLHKTNHGNMRNTVFRSIDSQEIDLEDRKYATGERGTAEMCNLYCSKMGRGHVHFLDCEKPNQPHKCVNKGSPEDKRRHCNFQEVLHERFWDTLGWEDPCGSAQEHEAFGKCAYRCDAADHDGKQASHCVLPVWHTPAAKPSTGPDSVSYVSGHKFECTHVTSGNKMHHIFVLDASGSMKGEAWRDLKSAFRKYVRNRINDGGTLDLVTMITFDGTASIAWEAQNISTTTRSEAPFRGDWTLFAAALRAANEVLSSVAFETFKLVVVFFSDDHPSDAHDGEVVAAHGRDLRQSISASLGTRTSLALTRPLHEVCCAVCQADLAVEATVALTPCGHELHQRCLRRLVECGTDEEASQCLTCRHDIKTE